MKKQERIRGILECGFVKWYKEYLGGWNQDSSFVSIHMESYVKQFNTSTEFVCSIDRDMPSWFVTHQDIISMRTLSGVEHNETLLSSSLERDARLRKEIELNPNYKEYFGYSSNIDLQTPTEKFVNEQTPAKIAQKLNEYVLGQEELTKATADFLYYHAMRLDNPQLPPRPMLISGPSGSGKTEVWRVIQEIYGDIFKIKIVNGARITQEGWKGSTKVLSFVDEDLADGGILVVDEFDKLATPQYSSGGDNVAERIQSEFLKLLEGEEVFFAADKRGRMSSKETTSKTMGFVLVGAFDKLLQDQETPRTAVGFGRNAVVVKSNSVCLTDEKLIDFGVLPELVGRIANKCTTRALKAEDYLRIVKNSNSRVSKLLSVLNKYGTDIENAVSDEVILNLVSTSQANRTGVRWVSSQVESLILQHIYKNGVKQPDNESVVIE